MSLVRITQANWSRFKAGIAAIEAGAQYPLGQDFFQIDHGENYLSFFNRLGELYYFAWMDKNEVAAVAAGILRTLPLKSAIDRAWYLCDLKVHQSFLGRHLALRMLAEALPFTYPQCPRVYAISMNPAGDEPNRTVTILKHSQSIRFEGETKLLIWSLNHDEMSAALPIIQRHRGPVTFLSLRGVKDIVLKSTGQPMNLLHTQFGPLGSSGIGTAKRNAVHMFCSPEQDPLTDDVERSLHLCPSASATIISHNMTNCDWRWVLTSDI